MNRTMEIRGLSLCFLLLFLLIPRWMGAQALMEESFFMRGTLVDEQNKPTSQQPFFQLRCLGRGGIINMILKRVEPG